ncbi:PKD domain-containing protein [Halomicrococcus sp. SG-WS-1]|uniref:PKD domain-containing protein n=1 Tax=Halomicrococcus sp. SG-WS-1 TaxID=3439057 RepID=UPI003F7AF7EE
MKDTAQKRLRQTTAALAALMLVLSVLGPVGTIAAAPGVSVSNSPSTTTATPGETVTITTTVSASDINGQGLQVFLPAGWQGTVTDADGGAAKPPAGSANVLEVIWLSTGDYEVTYEVQVPDDATPGDYTVTAEGSGIDPGNVDDPDDDTRLVDSAQTTITVEDPTANTPPTADAGDDQTVDEGTSVQLDASGSSDPDGDALSYSWTQTAGPAVSLSDTSSATPTFTAPDVDAETTLTFEVEVSDGNGGTATDTVSVTVEPVAPPNQSPTAAFSGPSNAQTGEQVTFDASASTDPDGSIASYEWDFGDGTTATGESVVHTFDSAGEYEVTLTVTDDDGATTTTTKTVTVEESQPTPGPSTAVSLAPSEDLVGVDQNSSFDLMVESADGGVGTYSITVELSNPSVATIEDVQLNGANDAFTDVQIADDGSSVTIEAVAVDTNDTGSVSLGTITVQGTAEGESDLSLTVNSLGTESGEKYAVTEVTGASITVSELVVGDSQNPAQDLDGDGVYEDVNGDGTVDVADVQTLWANRNGATVTGSPEAFDFNGDGTFDLLDIQTLYYQIQESA